jgi:hypothetical protein
MEAVKIKLVVIENHTLGYLIPNSDYAGILHASILKGSPYSNFGGSIYIKHKNIKLASKNDFDNFRVSFKGFDNENEYEFSK